MLRVYWYCRSDIFIENLSFNPPNLMMRLRFRISGCIPSKRSRKDANFSESTHSFPSCQKFCFSNAISFGPHNNSPTRHTISSHLLAVETEELSLAQEHMRLVSDFLLQLVQLLSLLTGPGRVAKHGSHPLLPGEHLGCV